MLSDSAIFNNHRNIRTHILPQPEDPMNLADTELLNDSNEVDRKSFTWRKHAKWLQMSSA